MLAKGAPSRQTEVLMIEIVDGIKIITGKSYRLVWTGTTHITTIEGTENSVTWTKQDVEEFVTGKQANNRKDELLLKDIGGDET